jgi:2-polyprenyl-6-methoxyphenol hydroxylase-like FAD-dependent oxidoreductase
MFHLCVCVQGVCVYKQRVVIVGAGPAGLCSALMLQQHGWEDITIVEGRPQSSFESEKAYLYLLNTRGQKITDLLGVTERIAERAVSSFQFTTLKEVRRVFGSSRSISSSIRSIGISSINSVSSSSAIPPIPLPPSHR